MEFSIVFFKSLQKLILYHNCFQFLKKWFFKCFENYIVGEEIGGCQSLRIGSKEEYGESYIGIEQGRSL